MTNNVVTNNCWLWSFFLQDLFHVNHTLSYIIKIVLSSPSDISGRLQEGAYVSLSPGEVWHSPGEYSEKLGCFCITKIRPVKIFFGKKGTTNDFLKTEDSTMIQFKVGLSPSKKMSFYFLPWKPFKNDEKCFLFHLKSSFRSQGIWIFVLTFWSCRRNGLIKKIRLI